MISMQLSYLNYSYQMAERRKVTQATLIENRPKVPAAVATGTDATHQYRLQKQLVPLASSDKGKRFGTVLKHHPVLKPQYRHRLVPPTGA